MRKNDNIEKNPAKWAFSYKPAMDRVPLPSPDKYYQWMLSNRAVKKVSSSNCSGNSSSNICFGTSCILEYGVILCDLQNKSQKAGKKHRFDVMEKSIFC